MAMKKSARKKASGRKKKDRKTRQRWRVGDVFQIDLPDRRYAYGRIYRDASVGIYRAITSRPEQPAIGSNDFLFTVGMYRDILDDATVRVIGRDPFPNEEAEWPPPTYIRDPITGAYAIYHKGEMTPSTEQRCAGLEEAAVWDYEHIVQRILAGGDPNAWRGKR